MSPSHTPARRRCVLVDDHQMVGQAVGGLLSELCNLELLAVVDKARAWQDLAAVISAWQADSAAEAEPPNPSAFPATEHPSAVSAAQLPLNQLTPRELRVFQCLGRGLLNKEIAQELRLSLPTVETYRKNLSSKLGISGAELVRAAALHRCVSAGAPSA